MEEYKQKYKQALFRMNKWVEGSEITDPKEVAEFVFPELKESEDERIREWLVDTIKAVPNDSIEWEIIDKSDVIAWLEKQVHVDKDEIVKGIRRSVAISLINHIDANSKGMCLSNMECEDIENAIVNEDWDKVYGYMKKKLEKQGEQKPQGKSPLEVWKDMRLEVYQQASGNRHEPNYSDDSTKMFSLTDIDEIFEKVVEKQGEQKFVDKCKDCNNVKGCITCTDGVLYTHITEQNPAWSGEDERILNKIQDHLREFYIDKKGYPYVAEPDSPEMMEYNWLKSIKDRVQPQSKQEWSEEDEKFFRSSRCYLNEYGNWLSSKNEEKSLSVYRACDWLKSLKERIKGE